MEDHRRDLSIRGKNIARYKIGLLVAVSLTAMTTPAFAQATSAGPAAAEAAPDGAGIGDIVVTAQRREERLQTVPIAITAIDGRGLEQAGIRDITRLEVLTPGLSVGQSGSDSRPALRGVNTDNSRQAQADSTIAFFIDGIYQSSNQQALTGFLDLARVEVQRGPQGTLYGRNSFGGNISLVSSLPGNTLEVVGRGEYSTFNHYNLTGVVSAPLGDTFGIRIAAKYEKSDGYVRNLTPGGTRAGDIDDFTGRLTLRWKPTDRLELIARGNIWQGNGAGGGAYEYKVEGIQVNAAGAQDINGTTILYINPRARQSDIPTLPAAGVPVNPDPYIIEQDTPSTRNIRNYAGSLELKYDLDFATLKLLGSYTDFDANRTSDGDFTAFLVRTNIQRSRNKTYTGEVQLASTATKPFQWIIGAYYLHTDAFEFFQQRRITLNTTTDQTLSNYGTESFAIYGQASYNLTDLLRVTGGIRYTDDKKTASGIDYIAPAVFVEKSRHFRKVTYRGAIDYQVDEDKLLYASVSSGFRSGGFNPLVNNPPGGDISFFRPETVTAYEIGAKTRWLDGTLQVNLSAFINDYDDIQINGFDGGPPFFTFLTYTQNVGRRRAKGVEAEILIKPVRALEVGFIGSYLDAHYLAGASAFDPINSDRISIAGKQSGFSPDYRVSAYASYAIDLGGHGTLTPRIQTSLVSSYYLTDFNAFIERQADYTKTDLRLTYAAPGDRFTIEGYVTNVENSAVKSVANSADAVPISSLMPRRGNMASSPVSSSRPARMAQTAPRATSRRSARGLPPA